MYLELAKDIIREFTFNHGWSLFYDDGLLFYRHPEARKYYVTVMRFDKDCRRVTMNLETDNEDKDIKPVAWQSMLTRWRQAMEAANKELIERE